jgi:hypothetical protein
MEVDAYYWKGGEGRRWAGGNAQQRWGKSRARVKQNRDHQQKTNLAVKMNPDNPFDNLSQQKTHRVIAGWTKQLGDAADSFAGKATAGDCAGLKLAMGALPVECRAMSMAITQLPMTTTRFKSKTNASVRKQKRAVRLALRKVQEQLPNVPLKWRYGDSR